MINTNSKINFEVRELTTNYFSIDTLTDFEYWVVLLTNKAIQEGKDFNQVVTEFVGEENDLCLLITKRFETLFQGSPENIDDFKEQAKEMEELTVTLKPSIDTMKIPYLKELDLYLFNNELRDLDYIKEIIKEQYNTRDKKFRNTIEKITDEIVAENIDVEIAEDFSEFNILNIKSCKNCSIISSIIEKVKETASSKISFDIKLISNDLLEYNEDYKIPDRHYGEKSPYQQMLNIDSYEENSILEFDFTNEGRYLVTNFVNYKGVPLVKENTYSISEFKDSDKYIKFIDTLSHFYSELNKKYVEWFIKNATTKEELMFIKDNNAYALNKKSSFDKLKLMIDTDVNIINDELIVKTELIDVYIKTDPMLLYTFLKTFYPESSFNDVASNKKNEILYNVYKEDSSILTKQHLNEIESIIKDSNLAFEYLNNEIKGFSELRSDIKDGLDKIKKTLKDETLNQEYVSPLTDKEVQLGVYKRIANFFVHIGDNDKSYKKDDKAVKEYNSKLINLKRDWRLYKKQGYLDHIDDDYLIILKGIVNEVKKTLKGIN